MSNGTGGARLRAARSLRNVRRFGETKVEPEGFEPSSKRPYHGLSTCLAFFLVFDPHLGRGTPVRT